MSCALKHFKHVFCSEYTSIIPQQGAGLPKAFIK